MEHIIWTSGLTAQPYIDRISPGNYTIQIWTDSTVRNYAENYSFDEIREFLMIKVELFITNYIFNL